MFVVFEGIDGSGKTTIASRVVEALCEAGVSVVEARPKGALKSKISNEIRTLARDPRHLDMSARTELLLFAARDAQTIDGVVRPALGTADVVIADRYLYSAMALAGARGRIPDAEIERVAAVASGGLWPDLVILCDVDIRTSNLRKTIDKIVKPREPDDFGRKGLKGLGLRDAMRRRYLALAAGDPERWVVVDNAGRDIEENVRTVANRILAALGRPALAGLQAPQAPRPELELGPCAPSSAAAVRAAFYQHMERMIASGQRRAAAHHLRSLDSDDAWRLRDALSELEPEVVAFGLEPLGSPRAVALRERLAGRAPRQVARSLNAPWAANDEAAWRLRERLADAAPVEVAFSLCGLGGERARALRERLAGEAPGAVLASLARLEDDDAFALRERLGKKKHAWGLLEGLAWLDGERAWELRDAFGGGALPWLVLSTHGLDSERAFDVRRRCFEPATKLVIRSLAGSEAPEAWEMRRAAGPFCKEALTTIKNLASEEAWRLREDLAARWPAFAAKSVGLTLAATPRGYDLLFSLAAASLRDPEVVRYAVKAFESRATEREGGAKQWTN